VVVAVAIAVLVVKLAETPRPTRIATIRCTFAPPPVPCDELAALGVCVAPHRDGALIVRVRAGSPAAREDWRAGDFIEEVDCAEARSGPDITEALASLRAPRFKIVRDGKAIAYRYVRL
jgi:S1-C subfamily serine protease